MTTASMAADIRGILRGVIDDDLRPTRPKHGRASVRIREVMRILADIRLAPMDHVDADPTITSIEDVLRAAVQHITNEETTRAREAVVSADLRTVTLLSIMGARTRRDYGLDR